MLLYNSVVGILATAGVASAASPECWRDTPCNGPSEAAFKGPWEDNHFAPEQRTVYPKSILSLPRADFLSDYDKSKPSRLSHGGKTDLVFDFGVEVGGILTIDYDVDGNGPIGNTTLGIAFTEAKDYIGRNSDNSNGYTGPDGALTHQINSTGAGRYIMPDAQLRGGFRYLTLFTNTTPNTTIQIKNISLEIAFQPTWPNLRAYQGYFHSADDLLNKIWYAGAYTLQTNSVPGDTCRVDVTERTGWQNDEFCGPGNTLLLDGAKRDRWVWIGDMGTAVPSAFYSTGDVESTRNALLAIFNYQSEDGTLPKAGPPYLSRDSDTYHLWTLIGTYNYFLYSGDIQFLEDVWSNYTKAMDLSLSKLNDQNILSVTGEADWGRWTYEPERSSANMLLYRSLTTAIDLTNWAPNLPNAKELNKKYTQSSKSLRKAIHKHLWDPKIGAFKDSPNNATLHPQDANSLALAFNVLKPDSPEAHRVSDYLQSNWTPIGPAVPELDNNISPFISSIELAGHFHIGQADRALQLIRDTWGWYLTHPNGTQSTVPEGYLVDGTWGYRGDRGYRNDPSYVSHAHGWSSGPTSTMSEYLVGLRVTKPQGEEWRFEPLGLGTDVGSAQAGFTTGLGRFSAKYEVGEDGKGFVEWDTPKGTRGFVKLPGQKGRWVKGGKGSEKTKL